MHRKQGRLHLGKIGILPGSPGICGGGHQGMPVVTIALPSAQRNPLDSATRQAATSL